jgi:hypothetical protein
VRARGRLGVQAAMRAAVVIADVLVQDALGVALAEDHHVVETVGTERPHQALADRVRQRRSRRREKTSHSEAAEPGTEMRIVDAVAVRVRPFATKKSKRKGFGWKRWSSAVVYKPWGLFGDYRLAYTSAKARADRTDS